MKLNHLNICTADVRAAANFFESYFGFRSLPSRAPDTIAMMQDETGFLLLFSDFSKEVKPVYPEGFHFGFILPTRAEVDRIFERLRTDGHASEPPAELHGSWTFYFKAPGDFILEVQSRAK